VDPYHWAEKRPIYFFFDVSCIKSSVSYTWVRRIIIF
jgi:hypothetical protein